MCLAVPMVIVELGACDQAVAEVGGTRCNVDVSLVEEPALGDYVIVHAGFAIERLDVAEAEARIELFREMSRTAPGAGTEGP